MPSPSRYRRVFLRAWDCVSAAGDAAASWRACATGRDALSQVDGVGWCGLVGTAPGATSLGDLAERAAIRPWATIAAGEHPPALAACSSKGDVAMLARALGGDRAQFLASFADQPTSALARRLGIGAYVPCAVAAACSTGLYAVLAGADLIERGICDRALVGAVDVSLEPLMLAGYIALGVTCGSTRPRAFAEPTGFAPAEGAGFVALAGDGPWRLVGGVRLGDAGHETRFCDPRTLATALEALWDLAPDPDLIVVHGTGTAQGDAYEGAALDQGPWRRCPRLACKPLIGHTLGASGPVELAIAACAPSRRLWKLSLGFGGHLAALALER